MMPKILSHFILGSALALTLACREDVYQDKLETVGLTTEEQASPAASIDESEHGLLPKAGPDDAFFISTFLHESLKFLGEPQEVVRAVESFDPQYVLNLQANPQYQRNAFDLRQNYSDERLSLMVDYLMFVNDKNGRERLTMQDLQTLKVNPGVLGNPGEMIEIYFDPVIYQVIAGEDSLVGKAELRKLLQALGTMLESQGQTQIRYRHQVLDAWDDVILSYDRDGDGQLNREEYASLRDDRQNRLEAMRSNLSLRYGI
ncbi:MAG: hypothetical protein ACOH5I_21635 [Oligoflexus sp.]